MTLLHRTALALLAGVFLFGCTVDRPINVRYVMFCQHLNEGFERCDNDEVICYVVNHGLSCLRKDK